MTKVNHELNLLADISKTLIETTDTTEITLILSRILNRFGRASNRFIELKTINIYIYDETNKVLRDYAKSWFVLDKPNANTYNDKLYSVITQLSEFGFFINGTPHKEEDLLNLKKIKTNPESNTILFPLKKGNKPFGLMELVFPGTIENLIDAEFFMMLSIASYQISLKIQNSILAEQMQKNIDFYKSMKNIAKIIETQYDLNYIIPIVGEMIDRFVTNHLTYVFLKDKNGKLNLVWPSSCKDKSICNLVSKTIEQPKVIIKDGGKVGIFPIIGKTSILGCIVAHSENDILGDKEINYVAQLCQQSSITIQRATSYAETLQHATLDALTGMNNRRQFEIRKTQELSNAKRQELPLCAIMIDIDFFKKVNDTYGHAAGDTVLKNVATIIKEQMRAEDIPSRYGGEEFAVMLPLTKVEEAYLVAERLRKSIEAKKITIPREKGDAELIINVTISMGLNELNHNDPGSLFENADKALYAAKESGRNKVVIYNPEA